MPVGRRAPRAPLEIVDAEADKEFERVARACGYDPQNRWVGEYAAYTWATLGPILEHVMHYVPGPRVLEFGCNMGAAAISAAKLSNRVTAIDIDPKLVDIARANARRYGLSERIEFRHVADTTHLPFENEAFDLVICSSVLEYIEPGLLGRIQHEIARVTARGGVILVTATSNR